VIVALKADKPRPVPESESGGGFEPFFPIN
jgi:hypothetical protein